MKAALDLGLAEEEPMVEAVAAALNVQRVHLRGIARDTAALSKLDAVYAEQKGVFPVQLKDNGRTLILAMADPSDFELTDEVSHKARARVVVMIAGETEIEHAIMRH